MSAPPDREFVIKALCTLRISYPNYHPAKGRGERSGEWALFIRNIANEIMRYDRIVVLRAMKRLPKDFPDVRFPNGGQILSVLNAERRRYRIEQEHANRVPVERQITTSAETQGPRPDASEGVRALDDLAKQWTESVGAQNFEESEKRMAQMTEILASMAVIK